MYHAPKESRPFHFERYEYSKMVPHIVKNLHTSSNTIVGYAGHDNYAVFSYRAKSGKQHQYKIAFNVFREQKKLRIHVTSAYRNENPVDPKKVKVSFEAILKSVRLKKELPKPRSYK